MSSLTPREKVILEGLFGMDSGYVIHFSDATLGTFFGELNIDIHGNTYTRNGSSKAKKLREFWRLESDDIVGASILGIIEQILTQREKMESRFDYVESEEDKLRKQKKDELISKAREIASRLCSGNGNLQFLKETTKPFDAIQLTKQINRMESAIQEDPDLAIGTAKELIETCCKTILSERNKEINPSWDVSRLTTATIKTLKLTADDIHDSSKGSEIIKRILQNLATVGIGIAELRNLYGTGHGKHGNAGGLSSRHAKLTVGAASTLATFLFETHKETIVEKAK